jgi:hypothetical protein
VIVVTDDGFITWPLLVVTIVLTVIVVVLVWRWMEP